MHRQPHPQHAAHVREVLYLPQATPIVRIAQHDLHRVQITRLGHVGKVSDGDVAGERSGVIFR